MARFTVTNTNDSGVGSLRQAITNANALSGKDIINFCGVFDDGLAHTISLTGGGLSITDDITILGRNPNLLNISEDSTSRVFDITSGATATINGLTITNSYNGATGGGGISNEGVLTLNNSIITGNTVTNNVIDKYGSKVSEGGGIYNTGTLTVNHSSITDNTAIRGGGIYNEASLTLNHSTINDNTAVYGGGIENSYTNATITTVNYGIITGNTAVHGGGIENNKQGNMTLNHSNINDNTASDDGGAIVNSGSLTLNHSTINDNTVKVSGSGDSFYGNGGGILNYSGSVTLNHSTINDNTAVNGGGIYMYISTDSDTVNLSVNNSSISDNLASITGGGIYLDGYRPLRGTITVNSSIISRNSALKGDGGGICDVIPGTGNYDTTGAIIYSPDFNPKTITVTNSIITDNSAGANGGGIYNHYYSSYPITSSTISLSNCIITGNLAGADGGGIYNLGIITLTNNIISSNSAEADGGGIYNGGFSYRGYKHPDSIAYGNLTVIESIISDNSASTGGGIYNYGTLSVSYSSISDNSAINYGGGIYNSSFNEFTLTSYFDSNKVVSRYNTFGIVNLRDSSINDNKAGTAGGGIYNDPDQDFGKTQLGTIGGPYLDNLTYDGLGIVTVSDSTISGNQAHFGAGIYNNATLTVGNSIIKHNKAFGIELSSGNYESGYGGGIYNNSTDYATATLNDSIIACNFDTPLEDSNEFLKIDNLVGKFINKDSFVSG